MKENKNIVSFALGKTDIQRYFGSGDKLTHVVANVFFFIYNIPLLKTSRFCMILIWRIPTVNLPRRLKFTFL